MNKEKRITGIVLAGAIALGGGAAIASQAEAATPSRTISCSTIDKWYPLAKGETVKIRATGAILPIDGSVDGVPQYDNFDYTSTITGLKSSNKNKKSWLVTADYPGSIEVLKCGANFGYTQQRLGREAAVLDMRAGKNDATKRVELNWLTK